MNTRTLIAAFAVVATLTMALGGCKHVSSSRAPATNVTGEVWYTKDITFPPGLMVWATKVYYCPKPQGKGPAQCIQAKIYKEGEGAPPPAFGAPAQPGFGHPPQPGYGAPAQPGFGPPAQPGFGPPPQPGFGEPQPTAPGYEPHQQPPPPPPPPSY